MKSMKSKKKDQINYVLMITFGILILLNRDILPILIAVYFILSGVIGLLS